VSRKRSDDIFDVACEGTPEELRALIGAGGKVDAVDGERFQVSSGSTRDQGEALDALCRVVNALLSRAGSSERLFALGTGNDAAVILLSPALASYAATLDVSPPLHLPA